MIQLTNEMLDGLLAPAPPTKARRVTVRVTEAAYAILVEVARRSGRTVTWTSEEVLEDALIVLETMLAARPSIWQLEELSDL